MAREDPTTEELRVAQVRHEAEERRRAAGTADAPPDDTEQHKRRADKAGYLREKLEERAEAERRAAAEDSDD